MSELYHHGILGQKWGVRRTPEQLGHKTYKKDVEVYGQKGAERIYKRINDKKMSRKKAERRESIRQLSLAGLTGIGMTIAEDLIVNKALFGVSITEVLLKKAKHDLVNRLVEYGKQKAARELIPKIGKVAVDAISLGSDSYTII